MQSRRCQEDSWAGRQGRRPWSWVREFCPSFVINVRWKARMLEESLEDFTLKISGRGTGFFGNNIECIT